MIFVTGGTGMVGGEIVRLLSQNGTPARALVRNPKNAKNLPVITWVTGDLAKPETLPAAFEGAKTLFLISSIAEDTVALQHNAIEAAREAGVTHIVKLSAFGASNHSKAPISVWHYQIEQEMQESGMEWTILRPHHFTQNLLTQTDYIINDGVVYSDSGDGKIPFIDARDIAAVAAVTLTKPGHYGKKYVITGSEALSHRQATEIISNTRRLPSLNLHGIMPPCSVADPSLGSRLMSAFGGKADIGWTCSKMRLGNKLRLVYCRASPHPTRDRRRSSARNCRRLPAVVRGSAPEPASAEVSAHLALLVQPAIRRALGAPKSCRRISARLAASQARVRGHPIHARSGISTACAYRMTS
jgi:uncharacterized protein YbjT (DUF2867 family)